MKHWTLFGAGNFTGEIIDAIRKNGDDVSLIVLNIEVEKEIAKRIQLKNIPIISVEDFSPDGSLYFWGFMESNKEPFLNAISGLSIKIENLIHPSAQIAHDASIGYGNYIGPGVVIGSSVCIGNHNFINRNASIGHDTVIGDMNKISPSVTICSFCNIDCHTQFGASSTLLEKLSVTGSAIIGAGAVATKNINKKGVYLGIPAKISSR